VGRGRKGGKIGEGTEEEKMGETRRVYYLIVPLNSSMLLLLEDDLFANCVYV